MVQKAATAQAQVPVPLPQQQRHWAGAGSDANADSVHRVVPLQCAQRTTSWACWAARALRIQRHNRHLLQRPSSHANFKATSEIYLRETTSSHVKCVGAADAGRGVRGSLLLP